MAARRSSAAPRATSVSCSTHGRAAWRSCRSKTPGPAARAPRSGRRPTRSYRPRPWPGRPPGRSGPSACASRPAGPRRPCASRWTEASSSRSSICGSTLPRADFARLLATAGLDLPGDDLGSATRPPVHVSGPLVEPAALRVTQKLDFTPPARPLPSIERFKGPFVHTAWPRDGLAHEIRVSPRSPDFVGLAEVPPLFVRALLIGEDAGFYGHPGLDLSELPLAVATNLAPPQLREGRLDDPAAARRTCCSRAARRSAGSSRRPRSRCCSTRRSARRAELRDLPQRDRVGPLHLWPASRGPALLLARADAAHAKADGLPRLAQCRGRSIYPALVRGRCRDAVLRGSRGHPAREAALYRSAQRGGVRSGPRRAARPPRGFPGRHGWRRHFSVYFCRKSVTVFQVGVWGWEWPPYSQPPRSSASSRPRAGQSRSGNRSSFHAEPWAG